MLALLVAVRPSTPTHLPSLRASFLAGDLGLARARACDPARRRRAHRRRRARPPRRPLPPGALPPARPHPGGRVGALPRAPEPGPARARPAGGAVAGRALPGDGARGSPHASLTVSDRGGRPVGRPGPLAPRGGGLAGRDRRPAPRAAGLPEDRRRAQGEGSDPREEPGAAGEGRARGGRTVVEGVAVPARRRRRPDRPRLPGRRRRRRPALRHPGGVGRDPRAGGRPRPSARAERRADPARTFV